MKLCSEGIIHNYDHLREQMQKQECDRVFVKLSYGSAASRVNSMEQMQVGEAYPASNLYGLGATCFHLLTGIHLWQLWQVQGYGWVFDGRAKLRAKMGVVD